jgi:hypothetical protein
MAVFCTNVACCIDPYGTSPDRLTACISERLDVHEDCQRSTNFLKTLLPPSGLRLATTSHLFEHCFVAGNSTPLKTLGSRSIPPASLVFLENWAELRPQMVMIHHRSSLPNGSHRKNRTAVSFFPPLGGEPGPIRRFHCLFSRPSG